MDAGARASDHRPVFSPIAHLAEILVDDLGRREAIALCRNNHWDGVLRAIDAVSRPELEPAPSTPGAEGR